jgi:hypothetical protein
MSDAVSLPPYSALVGGVQSGGRFLEVSEEALMAMLASLLDKVVVDEHWYLRTYRDVADAIQQGEYGSARDHYTRFGYFEDRLPREIRIDEEWYQGQYPDVREAIETGMVASGQQHFLDNGFREGRSPYAGWSLFS